MGEGSAGTYVFKGEFQPLEGRGRPIPAAVKRLRRHRGERGERQLSLVRREVDTLYKLQGSQARVVTYLALHAEDDWIYLGFERCAGSLAAALAALDDQTPPAPLSSFVAQLRTRGGRVSVLREVTQVLAEVHACGVSHNDLTANNVLATPNGTLKLHDLQLAVAAPEDQGSLSFSLTTFTSAGLELNMVRRAPEMLNGVAKLTNKVDIWALGLLAYHVLTGHPSPFASQCTQGPSQGDQVSEENKRIRTGRPNLVGLDNSALSSRECYEVPAVPPLSAGQHAPPFPSENNRLSEQQ